MFDPYDDTYQNTIGNRQQKAVNEEEKARVTIDPNRDHALVVLIATLANSKTMTQKQLDSLTTPVKIADKEGKIWEYSSPVDTWDYEPDYQSYIRALPATIESYNKRVTINNLIRYARGYDWKKVGYFAWKAVYGSQTTEVVVTNEPDSSIFDY